MAVLKKWGRFSCTF